MNIVFFQFAPEHVRLLPRRAYVSGRKLLAGTFHPEYTYWCSLDELEWKLMPVVTQRVRVWKAIVGADGEVDVGLLFVYHQAIDVRGDFSLVYDKDEVYRVLFR